MQLTDPTAVQGRTVRGSDGEKLGTVQDIYVDDATGSPEWAALKTGLFGSKVSLIPLAAAEEIGKDIVVPYGKDQIKNAPHQDPEGGLSPAEEAQLFDYTACPTAARP